MFDILEKLRVGQSDEIFGLSQINWEASPWRQYYFWSMMKKSFISLSHGKVYVFSDSVLCLGKVNQNPALNTVWEEQLSWFKSSPQYRALDTLDGEPMEFEWNIFPGFTTLQLWLQSSRVPVKNELRTTKISQDGSSSCRCSTTSHGDRKTMNRNAN